MDNKYPYPPTLIYNESVMTCCGLPRAQCTCNETTENAAGGFAPFGEPQEYIPDKDTQKPNHDPNHMMGPLPLMPEPTTGYAKYFNPDGTPKPMVSTPDSAKFAPFGEPQEYIPT